MLEKLKENKYFKFIPFNFPKKGVTYKMGSPESEKDRFEDETQHDVTLTESFEMGQFPVTQSQWEAVMGNNPSYFKGENNPVECVSWNDAQEFIKKLNDEDTEYTYRLPTEAEWEYCARGGTTTAYHFSDSPKDLGDYAWFYDNSGGTTHPVGEKKPNQYGLYDMLGNVWEWCQDVYAKY